MKGRIHDYLLVENEHVGRLNREVKALIKGGWQPLGASTCTTLSYGEGEGTWIHTQTMVFYEDDI